MHAKEVYEVDSEFWGDKLTWVLAVGQEDLVLGLIRKAIATRDVEKLYQWLLQQILLFR